MAKDSKLRSSKLVSAPNILTFYTTQDIKALREYLGYFQMVQEVVDAKEEAFEPRKPVSNSSGSPIPPGRNLGISTTKEEKEMGK
ncbi:unnamed protein product [Schistosoma curassoni]|uniref:SRP_SPB domain-containing protein n=1 Tax=Schistosoma curassoni TaxID=6186 RepID=A0A183JEV4_9TREM|nr:unnamed protein product [Schistosoma curassoni]